MHPTPAPFDIPDNGLSAFVDVNVFNGNLLLALAAMFCQGFNLCGIRPREFCGLGKVGLSAFCRL